MKRLKSVLSVLLVLTMAVSMGACNSTSAPAGASQNQSASEKEETITVAVLPKFKGENYWDACKTGAQEAIKELQTEGKKVEMIYDGPPQDQATNQKQVDILEGWIAQNVNAIVTGVIDPGAISQTLQKARDKGIKVVTFDSDSPKARDLFINQVSFDGIAEGVVKSASDQLTRKGYGPNHKANVAIISQTKTDTNLNGWIAAIKKLLATKEYNWMVVQNENTDIYYPGADESENSKTASTLLGRMGGGADQINCAMGITSMSCPCLGAAYQSAASKPDKDSVVITGLATPNAVKSYILDDTNPLKTAVLWKCSDLGYLAAQAGYQLASGELAKDATFIKTKRLGERSISKDGTIVLGDALIITKNNVSQYNY